MSKTELVAPLDAGWLWLESDSNLMHGSVLCLFTPPPDDSGFVDRLVERMRRHTTPVPPFDRRLRSGWRGRLLPQWEIVDEIDTSYHLRRVTVPRPGGQRELGQVVSRLHGTAIDHSRPPWTIDVIEGLDDGRFAILGRMHHALADGVSALRIVEWWLSEDADRDDVPPIWAYQRPRRGSTTGDRSNSRVRDAVRALRSLAGWLPSSLNATRYALTGVSARPWSAPRSALNAPITSRRRVSTQSCELARFKALSERASATINDVVLAVCAGGLRSYLDELGRLPGDPLITNIPVSIRTAEDGAAGNAISWAMVSLGTQIAAPRERLETIRSATVDAKRRLRGISSGTIDTYTLLAVTPILIEQLTRLGGRVPPLFNVPISNVPGPRKPLYFDQARLDELQALTVIYSGYALNIVAVSYADRLQLSFTACPDVLPHSQRLSVLCGESLDELEEAFALDG
jgi:diacylglycerol O-acyltransferase / wax synthase